MSVGSTWKSIDLLLTTRHVVSNWSRSWKVCMKRRYAGAILSGLDGIRNWLGKQPHAQLVEQSPWAYSRPNRTSRPDLAYTVLPHSFQSEYPICSMVVCTMASRHLSTLLFKGWADTG